MILFICRICFRILNYSQPSLYLLHEAGYVTWGLIATTDPRNESPVLRTEIVSLMVTCHFSFRASNSLFWFSHISTYMWYAFTSHEHKQKNNLNTFSHSNYIPIEGTYSSGMKISLEVIKRIYR